MKPRQFVISFILITVLAIMVTSCYGIRQQTETNLNLPKRIAKDLPVIGSTSNDGSAPQIKVLPTAPAVVVTLSVPTPLPSVLRSIDETLEDPGNSLSSSQVRWTLERVFRNLTFGNLTNLVQINEDTGGFIVTEQKGLVYYFPNDQDVRDSRLLLDLTDRVSVKHNEEGLLGIALSPNFNVDRSLYLYYSAAKPRRSVLSRFVLHDNSMLAIEGYTETVILDIPQPYGNHNGGQITFGPQGFLYISLGDGLVLNQILLRG